MPPTMPPLEIGWGSWVGSGLEILPWRRPGGISLCSGVHARQMRSAPVLAERRRLISPHGEFPNGLSAASVGRNSEEHSASFLPWENKERLEMTDYAIPISPYAC